MIRFFYIGLAMLGLASPAAANGFSSPSGNITCYLDVFSPARMDEVPLVCLIFDADWPMPPKGTMSDPTCDLDSTRTITLPRNGPASASWTCHGDIFWPVPQGQLSYGSEWSLMGYSCSVQTDGVRCDNGRGSSLWVRRASIALE